MWAFPIFVKYFKKENLDNLVVVSPDAGGVKRALHLTKRLDADVAMIHKKRSEHNKIDEMTIVGDVENKNVIIYDDMIDTAGTICKAAEYIKELGAKKVFLCATHALFSGEAINKLKECKADKVVVTNTLPSIKNEKIEVIDLSYLIATAIRNIHENRSVSTLDKQLLEQPNSE